MPPKKQKPRPAAQRLAYNEAKRKKRAENPNHYKKRATRTEAQRLAEKPRTKAQRLAYNAHTREKRAGLKVSVDVDIVDVEALKASIYKQYGLADLPADFEHIVNEWFNALKVEFPDHCLYIYTFKGSAIVLSYDSVTKKYSFEVYDQEESKSFTAKSRTNHIVKDGGKNFKRSDLSCSGGDVIFRYLPFYVATQDDAFEAEKRLLSVVSKREDAVNRKGLECVLNEAKAGYGGSVVADKFGCAGLAVIVAKPGECFFNNSKHNKEHLRKLLNSVPSEYAQVRDMCEGKKVSIAKKNAANKKRRALKKAAKASISKTAPAKKAVDFIGDSDSESDSDDFMGDSDSESEQERVSAPVAPRKRRGRAAAKKICDESFGGDSDEESDF